MKINLFHLKWVFIPLLVMGSFLSLWAQERDSILVDSPSEYKPLVLKVSKDGSRYIRFILWNQIWLEDQNLRNDPGFSLRIRRSRFLAYAQLSPRFLVLTHFGINNLTSESMDPLGNGLNEDQTSNGPQLFLHAAWTEFKVSNNDALYIGAGLHYWNGLSRMSSASTLNFMTLDNYRQAWAQLGLSDQFARHLGVYAKGSMGRIKYSLAINDPIKYALGSDDRENLAEGSVSYSGRRILEDEARTVITGYLEYQFLDKESNKLPYRVGTYLGSKRVFNIGGGFFNHKNGTVTITNGETIGNDVTHFSIDSYYDAPLGRGGINAYLALYNFNYGKNYHLSTTYGSGHSFYGHFGYLLPVKLRKGRFMPYVAYSSRNFEAYENPGNLLQFGANWFINGHNAKISLEYRSTLLNYDTEKPNRINGLIVQTHIYL